VTQWCTSQIDHLHRRLVDEHRLISPELALQGLDVNEQDATPSTVTHCRFRSEIFQDASSSNTGPRFEGIPGKNERARFGWMGRGQPGGSACPA
jgi:hypothetical protein